MLLEPNCHSHVKSGCQISVSSIGLQCAIGSLTAKGPPRQSQGFGPEGSGRMSEFHDVSNCQHERIELRAGYDQRRSNLQNREVVSADLSQESRVAKQTHHDNLDKHGRMNGPES